MDLKDRVVLLTGAKRMGAAIATAAAAKGADIALSYNRSQAEAEEAAGQVRAAGRRALIVQTDVADPDACQTLVERVGQTFGRLDVLVNMASVYQAVPFDDLDIAAWDHQLAVDLRSAFACSRAAVPLMRRSGGGRIVNFTDWVAASARPRYQGYLAYYVAKAGVKALTEGLALELAGDRILVNAVGPGPIRPPAEATGPSSPTIRCSTSIRSSAPAASAPR